VGETETETFRVLSGQKTMDTAEGEAGEGECECECEGEERGGARDRRPECHHGKQTDSK
jgi:hypothetical protein